MSAECLVMEGLCVFVNGILDEVADLHLRLVCMFLNELVGNWAFPGAEGGDGDGDDEQDGPSDACDEVCVGVVRLLKHGKDNEHDCGSG